MGNNKEMRIENAFVNLPRFDDAVREVERELRLEGSVVNLCYDPDHDSTGEPSVHFRMVLPDSSFKRELLLEATRYVG